MESHPDDLKRCALAFNLDQVGGGSRPDIKMLGGVKGMPADAVQETALQTMRRWLLQLVEQYFFAIHVP